MAGTFRSELSADFTDRLCNAPFTFLEPLIQQTEAKRWVAARLRGPPPILRTAIAMG